MSVLFRWMFFSCLMRIAAITVAVIAIFLIAESIDKSRYLADGLTTALLAEYLLLKIPFIIADFMPVIVLIGAGLYMAETSHHHELAALRAAGIAMPTLLTPLLAAAACAAFFTFALGQWVEPVTNQRLSYINDVHIHQEQPKQHGIQWLRNETSFLRLTPLTNHYFSFMMLNTSPDGVWLQRIDASKAIYQQGTWHLEQAYISQPNANQGLNVKQHPTYTLNSQLSPDTIATPDPRDMQWQELRQFAADLATAGLESEKYTYQLHRKIASPLACLFMVMLAYSLCSNMGSRIAANSKGLITAIVVGIGFYIFNTAIGLLTDGGQLPATYA
ncbi:MAG: LptF/LptG family permease, partial [Ghiorsea sp.]